MRRNSLPKMQKRNDHQLTQQELTRMYFVADLREKTILTMAVSLGDSIQDFLAFPQNLARRLVKKARENKEQFVHFKRRRGKTEELSFSFLSPEAIDCLEQYLKHVNPESPYLWHNHDLKTTLSPHTINDIVKKLIEKADITLTGRCSFHNFRKFLMTSAMDAGLNTYEAKYLTGKKLPISDATYLNLDNIIIKKIPNLLEKISLTGYKNHSKTNIEQLERENKELKKMVNGSMGIFIKYLKQEISREGTSRRLQELLENNNQKELEAIKHYENAVKKYRPLYMDYLNVELEKHKEKQLKHKKIQADYEEWSKAWKESG
jgi:hypothetical protein